MADYRSKSYSEGKMQIEPYYEPPPTTRPTNFRSYSTPSHNYAPPPPPPPIKKRRSANGSTQKSWSFKDPEFQRKRRVAGYKVYSVEGKLKGSVRKNVRWLKDKYTQMVYGWW